MIPTWAVMVSALAAVVALVLRWRVERRAVLVVKLFPAAWFTILYAALVFHWFDPGPSTTPSTTSAFFRFALCYVFLSQAFVDFFTANEIAKLRKALLGG